jgi:hypothetical protein
MNTLVSATVIELQLEYSLITEFLASAIQLQIFVERTLFEFDCHFLALLSTKLLSLLDKLKLHGFF